MSFWSCFSSLAWSSVQWLNSVTVCMGSSTSEGATPKAALGFPGAPTGSTSICCTLSHAPGLTGPSNPGCRSQGGAVRPQVPASGRGPPVSCQQLLMPPAQIGQALAVGAGGPGQLLLTAVMSCPNVLQSGLQECPKGCCCGLRACAICVSLEEAGPGPGRAALGRIQPLPLNSLPRAGPRIVYWAGLKSPTRSRASRRWLVVVRPGSGSLGPRGLPPSTGHPSMLTATVRAQCCS